MSQCLQLEEPVASEECVDKELQSTKDESRKKTSEKNPDQLPETFRQAIANCQTGQDKLKLCIEEMGKALLETPYNFRDFWAYRKWALDVLQEEKEEATKSSLWNDVNLLTQEARRLKDQCVRESVYAQEQIEVAIGALEQDIASPESQDLAHFQLELPASLFEQDQTFYNETQGELSLLNAYASKINSLRKELTRTHLRIKSKNQLFDRLSKAGDQVFPRRKDLIQGVSDSFIRDVSQFCEELSGLSHAKVRLSEIRDEIKDLQKVAKLLTLNTFAFNKTRQLLSDLWDQVKKAERERKKEISQFKQESQNAFDEIKAEFDQLVTEHEGGHVSFRQAEHRITDLQKKARQQRLDRMHQKEFRELIEPLKKLIDDKVQEEIDQKAAEEKRREEERKQQVANLLDSMHALHGQIASETIPHIESELTTLCNQIQALKPNRLEKNELQKIVKKTREGIREKKEEALLTLSDDEKATLDNLIEVLKSRKNRRKEIKEKLEEIRQQKGSTGFDFEQALLLDEQMQEEKQALDDMDHKIREISEQIDTIKSQAQ